MQFTHMILPILISFFSLNPPILAQEAALSPPRTSCVDIPGHVTCERKHNGLIHEAVVTAPDFTLHCRAFRHLWIKRYRGSSSRAETREVVVAGVCDQRALDGRLIKRWSTLDPLETEKIDRKLWDSPEQTLPEPVVKLISRKKKKGRETKFFSGYYLPEGWKESAFSDADATPGYEPFPPLGKEQAWNDADDRSSIVSPLFAAKAQCSDGFVVCTPYLKILHPNPELSQVEVEMVSARLFFNHRSKKSSRTVHVLPATFMRQSFGPEGPLQRVNR